MFDKSNWNIALSWVETFKISMIERILFSVEALAKDSTLTLQNERI